MTGEACTGGSGGASETQLRWILERISWLEEGLRIAHIERSEAGLSLLVLFMLLLLLF